MTTQNSPLTWMIFPFKTSIELGKWRKYIPMCSYVFFPSLGIFQLLPACHVPSPVRASFEVIPRGFVHLFSSVPGKVTDVFSFGETLVIRNATRSTWRRKYTEIDEINSDKPEKKCNMCLFCFDGTSISMYISCIVSKCYTLNV